MKNIYTLIMLTFSSLIFSQIGMGTPTPRGALDINSPTTNIFGLVLPTNSDTANMVNPQGGTIAEGTIMYDSQLKCARIFDGTTWSNCLVKTPPPTPIIADCSNNGFEGTFNSSVALSGGATFKVTVINNSSASSGTIDFKPSDLVLSGISGITVSGVSPTVAIIAPGQSRVVTYTLTGSPVKDGTLTGSWSKLHMSCSATVTVNKMIRFASFGSYAIGSANLPAFNSQLKNTFYYSKSGAYSGNFEGFSFIDITSQLNSLSAQDLLDRFDIISVYVDNLTVANVPKIKEFVDKGGVALLIYNNSAASAATNLFNIFGGTGTLTAGATKATTTNEVINNGIFGNATNVSINGSSATANFEINKLPAGAVILAQDNNQAKIFIAGNNGRALFFWDVDMIVSPTYVQGNIVNTPQEKALHNIMAYALGKAGL